MEQNQDKITFEEGYYENGQLEYKWRYLNGKLHGEQLSYCDNGELYYKDHYINDVEVTQEEWIKYNRNLKLESIWNKIKIK